MSHEELHRIIIASDSSQDIGYALKKCVNDTTFKWDEFFKYCGPHTRVQSILEDTCLSFLKQCAKTKLTNKAIWAINTLYGLGLEPETTMFTKKIAKVLSENDKDTVLRFTNFCFKFFSILALQGNEAYKVVVLQYKTKKGMT